MSSVVQPSGPSAIAPAQPNAAGACSLFLPGREAVFLDLEFKTADRLGLVTRLLAITAPDFPGPADSAALWQLSVASRLKRLLHIARDTERLAALPLRRRCPHSDCQQFLEIELAYTDLDALHDETADRELLRFPGADHSELTFRRPTGDDLRCWRVAAETGSASPQSLFHGLLVPEPGCAETFQLPPVQVLADAFAEFDTLVAFQLTTTCPHCDRESTQPVDLETLALDRLHNLQQQLFQENHWLAQAYGWSEAEIFQVSRSRRLRYLAQLEAMS
jgi:hypothetical protein